MNFKITFCLYPQSCSELPIIQESNSLTDMFPPFAFTSQNRKDYCKRRWNITVRDNNIGQLWSKKVSKSISNLLLVDSVFIYLAI